MNKKSIMKIAVLIGVILIPLAYSYFYLGAFWDPYAGMDQVPVAIVNEDAGAVIDDEDRNLGSELVDELIDDGSLKFIQTDSKDAEEGVKGDKYYASITIPNDFSKNISSASETKKVKGKLIFEKNEKRNYLASQIISTGMVEIEKKLSSKIDGELTLQLCDKLREVPDKMYKIDDGFAELEDGAEELNDGAHDLDDGVDTLRDGMHDLDDGIASLQDNSEVLDDGANTLDRALGTLKDKTNDLVDGVDELNDGAKTLSEGTSKVAESEDDLVELDESVEELNDKVEELGDGAKTYVSSANSLIANMQGGGMTTAAALVQQAAVTQGTTEGDNTYILMATLAGQVGKDAAAAGIDLSSMQSKMVVAYKIAVPKAIEAGLKPGTDDYNNYIANEILNALSDSEKAFVVGIASTDYGITNLQVILAVAQEALSVPEDVSTGKPYLKNLMTYGYLEGMQGTLSAGGSKLTASIDKLHDEGTQELYDTLHDSLYGSDTDDDPGLINALKAVNSGAASISIGTTMLKDQTDQLPDGIRKLKDGTARLADGTESLMDGADDLRDGSAELAEGTDDLKDGTEELADGTDELLEGVQDGRTELLDGINDTEEELVKLDGMNDYAETPVDVTDKSISPVPNYGTAFAPYFLSLSLWVGGLMIFFGIYLDADRRFPMLSRESDKRIFRTFAFLGIGMLQGVVLGFIVKWALGLTVVNYSGYMLSIVLVSAVFISIIQFCLVVLKDPGKLVAIILLILQLTSCAGTFPIETVPKLFQVLYPYMPMTYSVMLFKEMISGQTGDTTMYATKILLAIFVVFMVATIVLSRLRRATGKVLKEKNKKKAIETK